MSEPQTQSVPAKQGESKVGPGNPPEEHQFKPGQSGNPAGPPKRKTQLWVYVNQFMEMTDHQIAKVDRTKLTQAQKVALKLVQRAAEGKGCDSERLARYCPVTGYVRNLANGQVELVAEGETANLEDFLKAIRQSGLSHYIRDVETEWLEATGEFTSFGTRF